MTKPEQHTIQAGSRVVLNYRILLEDGTLADTSGDGDPLTCTMGDGTLVAGLELALYGLEPGAQQTLALGPEQAFGPRDEANVHSMPRAEFPAELTIEPGVIIEFTTPAGDQVPGAVRELDEDSVLVDFNHPLAGHVITFEVEILSVQPPVER